MSLGKYREQMIDLHSRLANLSNAIAELHECQGESNYAIVQRSCNSMIGDLITLKDFTYNDTKVL